MTVNLRYVKEECEVVKSPKGFDEYVNIDEICRVSLREKILYKVDLISGLHIFSDPEMDAKGRDLIYRLLNYRFDDPDKILVIFNAFYKRNQMFRRFVNHLYTNKLLEDESIYKQIMRIITIGVREAESSIAAYYSETNVKYLFTSKLYAYCACDKDDVSLIAPIGMKGEVLSIESRKYSVQEYGRSIITPFYLD